VLDVLAERAGVGWTVDGALRARFASATLAGACCGLLAPRTFMNRSGESVAAALRCWPELVPERDLLVVYDDLDLPLGRLRLRPGGSAGGHRGMSDIARVLATDAIPRLRFGIGRPPEGVAVVDWVLEPFDAAEAASVLPAALARAADAVAGVVELGLVAAMGRFNGTTGVSGPSSPEVS